MGLFTKDISRENCSKFFQNSRHNKSIVGNRIPLRTHIQKRKEANVVILFPWEKVLSKWACWKSVDKRSILTAYSKFIICVLFCCCLFYFWGSFLEDCSYLGVLRTKRGEGSLPLGFTYDFHIIFIVIIQHNWKRCEK